MRAIVRKIIVWALGGEPVIKGPEVAHDAAGLDKVISSLR